MTLGLTPTQWGTILTIKNNPWRPVTSGVPGIIQCYTIQLCYIRLRNLDPLIIWNNRMN
jgi:hypothetical protein